MQGFHKTNITSKYSKKIKSKKIFARSGFEPRVQVKTVTSRSLLHAGVITNSIAGTDQKLNCFAKLAVSSKCSSTFISFAKELCIRFCFLFSFLFFFFQHTPC